MIEFKQGQNPYDTMKIGSNRPIKLGDKFVLLKDYFLDTNLIDREWVTLLNWNNRMTFYPTRQKLNPKSLPNQYQMNAGTKLIIITGADDDVVWFSRDDMDITWVKPEWIEEQIKQKSIKRIS
jgi:hypothetical protein